MPPVCVWLFPDHPSESVWRCAKAWQCQADFQPSHRLKRLTHHSSDPLPRPYRTVYPSSAIPDYTSLVMILGILTTTLIVTSSRPCFPSQEYSQRQITLKRTREEKARESQDASMASNTQEIRDALSATYLPACLTVIEWAATSRPSNILPIMTRHIILQHPLRRLPWICLARLRRDRWRNIHRS